MIVVADATPLNVLIRIGQADLFPALFGRVLIPVQVEQELLHAHTPEQVRRLIASRPSWLEVHQVNVQTDWNLDAGEAAAIELARQSRADLLLIDDEGGRKVAKRLGLAVTGTVGILGRAAILEVIEFEATLDALRAIRFFIDPGTIDHVRRQIARARGEKL